MEESRIKTLCIKMDEEKYYEYKKICLDKRKTLREAVTELIEQDIQREKKGGAVK